MTLQPTAVKTLSRLSFWLLVLAGLSGAGWWLTRTEPPLVTVHTIGRGSMDAGG